MALMLLSHLVLLCCWVAAEGMSPSEMGPGKQGLTASLLECSPSPDLALWCSILT